MEEKRKEALLKWIEFVRQILLWAQNSNAEIGISFKKASDQEKIAGLEEFFVNDVTETSFSLRSGGKRYPQDKESSFLIEEIASITEYAPVE